MRLKLLINVLALLGLAAPVHGQSLDAAACEKLASLKLAHATLASQSVGAGEFSPPASPPGGMPNAPQAFADLPAMCRVTATLKPSSDSDIKVEVWLPAAGWNGKLQGVGNGGWAGSIFYFMMANALRSGYAVVATDTGHAGGMGDGTFAFNHPEKLTDFAWRAVHEMTVTAKAVIEAYYGKGPRLSYWNGCSTGGRQGLKEAQRFPSDYDGILDGAPANYMTHLADPQPVGRARDVEGSGQLHSEGEVRDAAQGRDRRMRRARWRQGRRAGESRQLPVRSASRCSVRPGPTRATCLTAPQVDAARKIYGPARNPRTGAEIFPGLERGSEMGWGALAGGPAPLSISADHFKYIVFKDPALGLPDARLRQGRRDWRTRSTTA